MVLSITK